MPFYAPASNTKTGNGEDLYVPTSDVGGGGVIDVIDGNLLVTGTITANVGVVSEQGGVKATLLENKLSFSDNGVVLSVNSNNNKLSIGSGADGLGIGRLAVKGAIASAGDITTSAGTFSTASGTTSSGLAPTQLSVGVGSGSVTTLTGGELSLNNGTLTMTASGSGGGALGPAGATYTVPNLTVTGTLTANLPQSATVTATKYQLSTLTASQTTIPCIPIALSSLASSATAIRGWGGIYRLETTQTSPSQAVCYFTNSDLPQIPTGVTQYASYQLPVMWILTPLGGSTGTVPNIVPSMTIYATNYGTSTNPITLWNVFISNVGTSNFPNYPFSMIAIPLVP
jgi:hypothetical protein